MRRKAGGEEKKTVQFLQLNFDRHKLTWENQGVDEDLLLKYDQKGSSNTRVDEEREMKA